MQAFGMIWWTRTVDVTDGFLWWSARFQKNAYKRTAELDSGLQMDRHCDPTSQIITLPGVRARVVGAKVVVYKLWRCSAFSSVFSPRTLQTRRLDSQLATNCQSTIMSSVTPHRSDNDGPQPRLVIELAHDAFILMLAYLPDGRRVVSGNGDGTVRVWNLEDGEQEGTSMEQSGIHDISVTRDGTKIISSDYDGEIKVWNVESHEIVEEWTQPEGCPNIAISPDDRLIAVGGGTVVAFYTMEGSQVNHSIEVDSYVDSLCFSPNGKKLACRTSDGVRVYDVDSGTLLSESQQVFVGCVLWSCDGSRLFREYRSLWFARERNIFVRGRHKGGAVSMNTMAYVND